MAKISEISCSFVVKISCIMRRCVCLHIRHYYGYICILMYILDMKGRAKELHEKIKHSCLYKYLFWTLVSHYHWCGGSAKITFVLRVKVTLFRRYTTLHPCRTSCRLHSCKSWKKPKPEHLNSGTHCSE